VLPRYLCMHMQRNRPSKFSRGRSSIPRTKCSTPMQLNRRRTRALGGASSRSSTGPVHSLFSTASGEGQRDLDTGIRMAALLVHDGGEDGEHKEGSCHVLPAHHTQARAHTHIHNIRHYGA
jgi:hypothetical protein